MPLNSYQYINFKAGRTEVLSDFDGTFMPKEYNHDVICNDNPPVDKDSFGSYFGCFKKFLDDDKKTSLTISTGRNLFEFNYYMDKIRQKGLEIPCPDKLIITNGGDEFIRNKDVDYFKSSASMFNLSDRNRQKSKELSAYTVSYDENKARIAVQKMLKNIKGSPIVFQPETHQGMFGYKGNMTLQERLEKNRYPVNYVSMRNDGHYQIRLTTANGSPYAEELKKIPLELEKSGYKLSVQINEFDDETFVNSINAPKTIERGMSINIKPETKGKVKTLDKFHHAKITADNIMENNTDDLLIVCGDGRNDLDVLNLSNYFDDMQTYEDFSKEEYREEVKKLPVFSIFVRNSSALDDITSKFESIFNFDGVKRFIIVDKNDPERPDTLLDAIKLAQEEYSKVNPYYEKSK